MAEGRFVAVYHEDLIANYQSVWDNDRLLATWLRLFALADKLWPSPAEMPRGVSTAAVKHLTDVGLIEQLPMHRYRVRGLDARRQRTAEAARNAADKRWGNADSNASGNADEMPKAMPRTDTGARPQSASGSKFSPTVEIEDLRATPAGRILRLVTDLTHRDFGFTPGSRPWTTLFDDVEALGADAVEAAYRATVAAADRPLDAAGVIFGGHKRLYPIPSAPRPTPADTQAEREAAARAAQDRRVERTRRDLAQMRGEL